MITVEMLKKIAPGGKTSIMEGVAKYLNIYMPKYDITSALRVQHFLAQAAHESAGFKTLEEYASGAGYEGREDLGNTHKGDGVRYKGRGIFQLTGRHNYKTMGEKLGKDLEGNPELAETPELSVLTALEYWKSRSISVVADKDDVLAVSIKINGKNKKTGLPNGLEDRKLYLSRAKKVIPSNFKFEIATDSSEPLNIVMAKHGDKGAYVADLQKMLIAKGYNLGPAGADGDFGAKTGAAVKEFQIKNGLEVTGNIDTNTINKLMV